MCVDNGYTAFQHLLMGSIGAPYLLTVNTEYQYQVLLKIGGWQPLLIRGWLLINLTLKNHAMVPVLVCWVNTGGSTKLDIATPIRDREKNKNIQFYIGLGSEL